MKEFITAVEDAKSEGEDRESKIAALVEKGMKPEEAEKQVDGVITFSLDGREMWAYPLEPGQLAFLLAALGRGQSQESRFAAIVNIMMNSLRSSDADYFESRLLTRDPKHRLKIERVEEIFEYLTGEWFGGGEDSETRPTPPSSGSA